jgi:hypothetical protein
MKKIMITLLLSVLWVTLRAGAAYSGVSGDNAAVRTLRSVIIKDYIIYDNMQTFAEVMEDFRVRIAESCKSAQYVNLVVRSKKYATRAETPKMRGLEMPSASVYEILETLKERKDLLYRISGNVVFVVGPRVPLRKSFSETYGKCRVLNEQLDCIIFPAVDWVEADIKAIIHFLRESTSRFSPNGKGVLFSHAFAEKQIGHLPGVTLNLRNVSLRELLNSICFVTGWSYCIYPDKIVFFSKRKN